MADLYGAQDVLFGNSIRFKERRNFAVKVPPNAKHGRKENKISHVFYTSFELVFASDNFSSKIQDTLQYLLVMNMIEVAISYFRQFLILWILLVYPPL